MKGDGQQTSSTQDRCYQSAQGVTAQWRYLVTRGQTDGSADMDNSEGEWDSIEHHTHNSPSSDSLSGFLLRRPVRAQLSTPDQPFGTPGFPFDPGS